MADREKDFAEWADSVSYALYFHRAAVSDALNLPVTVVTQLSEEIANLAAHERRQIRKHLTRLLAHLLKWRYCRPAALHAHGDRWRKTMRNSRDEISEVLKFSPSLEQYLAEYATDLYPRAAMEVSDQTGVAQSAFPAACPWNVEQILLSEPWVF